MVVVNHTAGGSRVVGSGGGGGTTELARSRCGCKNLHDSSG